MMELDDFLQFFEYRGVEADLDGDVLRFDGESIPVIDGIPRFVDQGRTYSDGNFSRLRERHARLQLDSVNGTSDRRDTILERTNWEPERFQGKTLLECGCGAGPDTEVLLDLGARVVAADLVGLDVARRNLAESSDLLLMQADITDLPLKRKAFDIVFCHRVLQHTPDPEATLRHILNFVKPGGQVFVHSYARTAIQMLNWKYVLRPITKRLPPESLYRLIEISAPGLCRASEILCGTRFGRIIQYVMVPFRYYGHLSKYEDFPRERIVEYGVHDTFDALSPKYDRPMSARTMESIGRECLDSPFEVVERPTVTLLRTL